MLFGLISKSLGCIDGTHITPIAQFIMWTDLSPFIRECVCNIPLRKNVFFSFAQDNELIIGSWDSGPLLENGEANAANSEGSVHVLKYRKVWKASYHLGMVCSSFPLKKRISTLFTGFVCYGR